MLRLDYVHLIAQYQKRTKNNNKKGQLLDFHCMGQICASKRNRLWRMAD